MDGTVIRTTRNRGLQLAIRHQNFGTVSTVGHQDTGQGHRVIFDLRAGETVGVELVSSMAARTSEERRRSEFASVDGTHRRGND